MEITNIQKYTHTSPRKMRLVVDMIKKMRPVVAMTTLHFTSKSAALDLQKIISTAVGNAKQGGLNLDEIYFKSIEVNEGPVMKRFRPGSKGRALPYQRRMSHIKIVLSDDLKIKDQKSKIKNTVQKSKVEESVIPSEAEGSQDSKEVKKSTPKEKVKKEAK